MIGTFLDSIVKELKVVKKGKLSAGGKRIGKLRLTGCQALDTTTRLTTLCFVQIFHWGNYKRVLTSRRKSTFEELQACDGSATVFSTKEAMQGMCLWPFTLGSKIRRVTSSVSLFRRMVFYITTEPCLLDCLRDSMQTCVLDAHIKVNKTWSPWFYSLEITRVGECLPLHQS